VKIIDKELIEHLKYQALTPGLTDKDIVNILVAYEKIKQERLIATLYGIKEHPNERE